jgi:hypothetical protein
MSGRVALMIAIVVAAIAFLIGIGIFLAKNAEGLFNRGPELVLPILIITGVLVLLVTLSLTAFVFAIMDISDKTQALALPEGSVRAVLALSLVVLFPIVSIFLYSNLSNAGKIEVVSGLTKEQKDQFQSKVPSSQIILEQTAGPAATPTYTLHYRQVHNPASEDFAKQLLVLIGTLVTAVASFYFGAKTAGAAQSSADPRLSMGAPAIRSVNPAKIVQGVPAASLEIAGDNLDLVKEVKAVMGAQQVLATEVMSNSSTVKCKLAMDQNAPNGSWDLIVTDSQGRQAKLPGALTV